MAKITAKGVVSELEKLKNSRRVNPTDSNGQAIYQDPKGRKCIVGVVLSNLGAKLPDPDSKFNCLPVPDPLDRHADENYRKMFGVTRISEAAAIMLGVAQGNADQGLVWSKAVKAALSTDAAKQTLSRS